MELIKLVKIRDEVKGRIEILSKELYDVKDEMEDILIQNSWSPELRGRVVAFADLLDSKTDKMDTEHKFLDYILKEIDEYPETKTEEKDTSDGCQCGACKTPSLRSKILSDGLLAAIRLKAALESQEKEEERVKQAEAKLEVQKDQWRVIFNWSFPVGPLKEGLHEKIFDSLREAEEHMEKMTSSYLRNLFFHCGEYSFSVSLKKI